MVLRSGLRINASSTPCGPTEMTGEPHMIDADPYLLDRFVAAQDGRDPNHAGIRWSDVTTELGTGHKQGHWMWFVFPQVDLGHTPTSHHFAIMSQDEALAYLAHPILGPRLKECTRLVLACGQPDAVRIFGHIDSRKFRSSMTLFHLAAPDDPNFDQALKGFFGGDLDHRTEVFLRSFPDAF